MKNKAGSVAPKERINIIYKPNDSANAENTELPLRLMVTGDFTGREDGSPVEERELLSVNRKNFGSVMEKMGAQTSFQTQDTLSGKDDEVMNVDLKFKSIKDFNPDNVAQNVPQIQKLLKLRESLVALKGPIGNLPNLRKVIQNKINEEDTRQGLQDVLKLEHKDDSESI